MSDEPSGLSSSSANAKENLASSSSATDDIEKLLNREASAFQREVKVDFEGIQAQVGFECALWLILDWS